MTTKIFPTASSANPAPTAPVQTFRLGRINAAVWANEHDEKKYYNVTFARSYLGQDKKFHDTDSFGRDDLPLIAKLANEVHSYIFTQLAERKAEAQTA